LAESWSVNVRNITTFLLSAISASIVAGGFFVKENGEAFSTLPNNFSLLIYFS